MFVTREALNKDPVLTATVLDALYKESKKESVEYRRHGVKGFADVLHALEVDRFTQLYDIAQEILIKVCKFIYKIHILATCNELWKTVVCICADFSRKFIFLLRSDVTSCMTIMKQQM